MNRLPKFCCMKRTGVESCKVLEVGVFFNLQMTSEKNFLDFQNPSIHTLSTGHKSHRTRLPSYMTQTRLFTEPTQFWTSLAQAPTR